MLSFNQSSVFSCTHTATSRNPCTLSVALHTLFFLLTSLLPVRPQALRATTLWPRTQLPSRLQKFVTVASSPLSLSIEVFALFSLLYCHVSEFSGGDRDKHTRLHEVLGPTVFARSPSGDFSHAIPPCSCPARDQGLCPCLSHGWEVRDKIIFSAGPESRLQDSDPGGSLAPAIWSLTFGFSAQTKNEGAPREHPTHIALILMGLQISYPFFYRTGVCACVCVICESYYWLLILCLLENASRCLCF